MKHFLFLVLLMNTFVLQAQTLLTVGKETVSKQQFLTNYNKNYSNANAKPTIAALNENLELLIKYKLKVKAAYDAKLDTLPNQKEDLINFRRQVEGKYLTEDKMMKLLINEAHQRMQKDIQISHIITLFEKNGDTTLAYKKINEAYKKLQKGELFTTVATQMSEDPSVSENQGSLGYITAFSLPYNLENLAYNTPLKKYSSIYKSNFGYHILYRNAERKAVGKMYAAQILAQFIPGEDPTVAKNKIDALYTKLQGGENFENLARASSNDVYSAQSGGAIEPFGIGKYEAAFENTFANLKDGEISKPFQTNFGWHILKRVKSEAPTSFLNSDIEQEIIGKINSDSRKQKAEALFTTNVLKQVNYKAGVVNIMDLYADANAKITNPNASTKTNEKAVLHSFNNIYKITADNFFKFAIDARATPKYKNYTVAELHKEFINVTAKEYYKNNLELFNSEFKAQLQEFKDGNLLFEIMERNVWNKSATDEDGLKKFYAINKQKYLWQKSADAIIFNSNNLSELNTLQEKLANKKFTWQSALAEHSDYVRGDSGRYELGNIPVMDRTAFSEGLSTLIFSPNNDGNYVFAYILKMYEAGAAKDYEEAKGLIINDYQNKIEEEWLASLRKKYPVKVNDAVWKSIQKGIK
jgi:peptidyl-prolyl cis-trans isomerase SurA